MCGRSKISQLIRIPATCKVCSGPGHHRANGSNGHCIQRQLLPGLLASAQSRGIWVGELRSWGTDSSSKHWSVLTLCRFVIAPSFHLSTLNPLFSCRPSRCIQGEVIGFLRRNLRHPDGLPSTLSSRSVCGMMCRGKLNNKCSKDQGKRGGAFASV